MATANQFFSQFLLQYSAKYAGKTLGTHCYHVPFAKCLTMNSAGSLDSETIVLPTRYMTIWYLKTATNKTLLNMQTRLSKNKGLLRTESGLLNIKL